MSRPRKAATVTWEGEESLRELLVPVETLTTHPENPRRGDVERIAESLTRFGQTRPILVQSSTGFIVAGNHTYRAAVEQKRWTHVARTLLDVDDETARAYLVADNRLSDLGDYDYDAQIALLNRLQDHGQLEGTGFTADEVDDEIARLQRVAETEPEPFAGDFSETEETRAAREAARAAAPILREVVLMFDPARYATFGAYVKVLQKEYGIKSGTIDTVFEAVEREARRVNEEGDG